MRRTFPLISLLFVASFVPAACSKDPPPPAVPTVTPDAGSPIGTPSGYPSQGDSGAPSAVPSASASANVVEVALDAAIDLAIKTQATQAAPGMTPVGQPGRATLAEGGQFGMVVNLEPNQCYTVLGFSPTGQVTELDLKLMTPPFYTVQAGASGAGEKNQPVIGKGKGALCPFLPVTVAYKVEATAKKGTGRIGVQVYSRAK